MKQEIKRRSCSRPSLENICIVTLCSLLLLLEYQYDECFRKVLAIRICILWINTRWPHNWHCEHFRGLIRESHIFFSSAPQLKQEVVKLNTSPVYTSHPCSQDMNLNEICVGFFFMVEETGNESGESRKSAHGTFPAIHILLSGQVELMGSRWSLL